MEGEGYVVFGAPDRPVAIPAIAEHEAFEAVEIVLPLCRIDGDAAVQETEVDEDAKELPIVVDEIVLAPGNQIGGNASLGGIVERIP